MHPKRRFERWARALIVTTLFVILWGAYVRVTGSGAGCAEHWPLCNGELLPRSPGGETVIELTHRVTSGLAGILAVVVFALAWRAFPVRSPVRRWAGLALGLMLVEGAIGALLVKKGLVANDASASRAWVVGLHLCNTFLLLAAQLLSYRAARGDRALAWRGRTGRALALLCLLLLTLLLGASGAITALGDTLFPTASVAEGLRQDFSGQAHFLVRLRVWHPLLALGTGALVVCVSQSLRSRSDDPAVARWALALTLLYLGQVALGSLNLLLLAPAAVQILHLLLADLLWLALIELCVAALSVPREQRAGTASVQEAGRLEHRIA